MDKESATEQICIAIQGLVETESKDFDAGYARGVIWVFFKSGFLTEIEHTSYENIIEALYCKK
jgi:hypothetical protein